VEARSAADRILYARQIHTTDWPTARAVALCDGRIVALFDSPEDLDACRGANTDVIDCRDLTIMPAFEDAHEHLMEAARNEPLVQMQGVTSIGEMIDAIRKRASSAASGEWIMTATAWHESDLAENRMRTVGELDEASGTRLQPLLLGHTVDIGGVARRDLADLFEEAVDDGQFGVGVGLD
jgi:predicted amidohydrolase YtcJ